MDVNALGLWVPIGTVHRGSAADGGGLWMLGGPVPPANPIPALLNALAAHAYKAACRANPPLARSRVQSSIHS